MAVMAAEPDDLAAAVTVTGEPTAEPEAGAQMVTPAEAAVHAPEDAVDPLPEPVPEPLPLPEPVPLVEPDPLPELLDGPKNSAMLLAVAAAPGKLVRPSASPIKRSVFWC